MTEINLSIREEPNIFFIDKTTYNSLVRTEIPEQDIYSLLAHNHEKKMSDKVSFITSEFIVYFNSFVNNFLFSLDSNYKISDYFSCNYLTDSEKEFIRDKVNWYFLDNDYTGGYSCSDKFYEVRTFANNSLLVIVSKGFLNLVANGKDKLLEFILSVIRYLDSSGRSSDLFNRLYLNLKLNDSYFTLLRSKLGLL